MNIFIHLVCLFDCLFSEQVSARIVQEVTAEAVAVLKGEQETQRLPSGESASQQALPGSNHRKNLLSHGHMGLEPV